MGIMKAGVLEVTRIKLSHLPLWAMKRLGIAIACFSSSRKPQREDDNDNGINRLPDDILCNIVTRLSVIEASRTSTLCRRWRKIWTMNPLMKFSCLCTLDISKDYHDHVAYGDKRRFFKAVNQCIELFYGQKLKAFFLHCCFLNGYTSHLVRWIETIARLDVEELYLGHSCRMLYFEPLDKAFTFSFKLIDGLSKLWKLDLMFCYVETNFVAQCHSLVRLTLRGIPLLGHELSDILLYCPKLENLEMKDCDLPQDLRITGPNLKLEILELDDCYYVRKLEISGSNLVTIKINLHTEVEILLSSIPKLDRLYLMTPGMHYCFGDLPQLKFLLIQTANQIHLLPPTFQVFGNLRVLRLLTRGYPYREASQEVDLWNFAPVLSACPLLEKFYLTVGGPFLIEARKAQWPALRHKHLNHMELSGFSNTQNELEFAKFILANAEELDTLILRSSSRRFDGERFYFEATQNLKPRDTTMICAYLQAHALSIHARVKMF